MQEQLQTESNNKILSYNKVVPYCSFELGHSSGVNVSLDG